MRKLKPIARFEKDVREGDLVRVVLKTGVTVVGYNGKGGKMTTTSGDKYRVSLYMFSGVIDNEHVAAKINPYGLAMPSFAGTSVSPVNIFIEGEFAKGISGYEVLKRASPL